MLLIMYVCMNAHLVNFLEMCVAGPGLPDGLFSNQKFG
jgi:hypothetical protein